MTRPSGIERKWWFIAPVSALTAIVTAYLMESAGVRHPYTFSQWVLYMLCFTGFYRALSFALLLCLPTSGVAPKR